MNLNNTTNAETEISLAKCSDIAFCQRYGGTNGAFNAQVTIFHIVVIIIIAIITFFINGIFIFMMYMLEELKNTSNYLFLNIALVNNTFGLSSLISCCVYYKTLLDCTVNVCLYRDVYVHISGTALALTMSTLSVISIERYICIAYALRWKSIVTNRRVVIVLGLVWIFWIALSTYCRSTETWNTFRVVYMIHSILNISIIIITNIAIFKEIRRHEKRITEQERADVVNEIRRAREKKRSKTFILMASLIVACYLPSLVLLIGVRIPGVDPVSWQYTWFFTRTIFLSHTAFDIIVYGLRSEETINGFKKIARRFCIASPND